MKTLLSAMLMLVCQVASAQQTFNNITVKTNLTVNSGGVTTLGRDPLTDFEAATKQYVDDVIGTTNSVASKLDITNGVAQTLTINGVLTKNQVADFSEGIVNTSLIWVGDSFSAGATATDQTNAFPYLVASETGQTLNNLANGSFSVPDANWSLFSGWAVTNTVGSTTLIGVTPSTLTESDNFGILIGFNDVRGSPTVGPFRKGVDHLIAWAGIPNAYKTFAQASSATTGTWTNLSWLGAGNIGSVATANGSTKTFTNVVGDSVVVAYLGWATNGYGSLTVTIDGVSQTAITTANAAYGNRTYINGSDPNIPNRVGPYGNGKLDFCPQIARYTGLGMSAHTVVVTADTSVGSTYLLWVAGDGRPRTRKTGPNVFFGSIPSQGTWTASGTDARQASFNSALAAAVDEAASTGIRVTLAPVAGFYLPFTQVSGDGVHPGNTGHRAIANAFETQTAFDLPSFAFVTKTDNFARLRVAGTANVTGTLGVTGVTTLGDRLLVLPTANSTGYTSRFGYATVAASGVSINHSDTTNDRLLTIGGNFITPTVNSTGAAANLSIGSAGANINVPGGVTIADLATVGTTFGVTGLSTLTGGANLFARLQVIPTISSGGTISRFGAAFVGASSVAISASDTGLDRLLTINGNSITPTINSTGAAANMLVGSAGANVNIPGTASVTGAATLASVGVTGAATVGTTLGVTGASTFSSGSFSGLLSFGAGLRGGRVSITTSTTLTSANWSANINDTSGSIDITLPASPVDGDLLLLKKTGGGNTTRILAANAGSNYTLALGESVLIEFNGTVWNIKAGWGAAETYTGTVTTVSVASANGFSGSVANATTTPAITIVAGAITPSSVAASGAVSGSSITAGGTTGNSLVASAALASDDTYSGNVISGLNSGTTTAQWEAVYLGGSSTWLLADANGSGTYPARGLGIASSTSSALTVITSGTVRNDAFNFTPGGTLYLSTTAGSITQTAPSASGDKVQQIGFALTADIIFVDFSSGEFVTVE